MKTRKVLALVLSLVMLLSVCSTAFAYHTTDEVTKLEQDNSDISMSLAAQAYVLLENNGVLPLEKIGKIALYGNAIAYTVKGGTGSGAVNNRLNAYGVNGDNIADAFVDAGWTVTNPEYVDSVRLNNNGSRRTSVVAASAITDAQIAEGRAADTAIYAIARNAGEGQDRNASNATNGYNLTDVELANIQKVCDAYENVIIVYNTCVMDASWQKNFDNIDAVVYMNNGGQRGSEALVKCLISDFTFSGKLTDTWAMSYQDFPSTPGFANNDGNQRTEYYTEGIYVGYRYFDTFGKEVMYPFGYGLSYADFQLDIVDVQADAEKVSVKVNVTNVGPRYAGREVVQVYFSAPDGTLEKPYQELAGYAKTSLLEPGDSQVITINFDTTDMSSYSTAQAGYIMERGDYIIRVGNSSRNTHVAAVLTLGQTVVTEKLINQFPLETGAKLDELSKAGATPITYPGEAAEIAGAKRIPLTGIKTIDNSDYNDAETITTYLFEEDAENYVPRDEITLTTRTVAGIIENAQNPAGPAFNGHQETTYKEVVEIVTPLPEGITKENAKLTDVFSGKITLKQFITCLSAQELARLCVGGAGNVQTNPDGTMIGASASSVNGGAGQTTQELFQTRHIPAMPNADGPAGIRITQSYSLGSANLTHEFDVQGSGRYVRVNLRNPATSYGFSIYELQLFSGGTNVALGKTATAKTEGVYNNPPYTAAMAVDGDMGSRWGSDWSGVGDTQNSWLQVDLGQVYNLDKVVVAFEAAYARTYDIQVSNDGVNFTTIYTYGAASNTAYQFCTAFPAGTAMAMTWDTDMLFTEGQAVGAEMKEYGVTTWLAPGMNIHRNPLCGRNFEYYSEDPLITGLCAAYVTLGVQAFSGIGVTLKHFWGNSQETNRNAENNVVGERAAREIYLKGFEIAVKLSQPMCVMNAYNVNQGWPASDDWNTNEDLLRSEWGFKGYVMTDWGGGQSTAYIAKHGGCDMVMPGGNASVILNGYNVTAPTFNDDGSIRNAGGFVPKAGGSVSYTVPTNAPSEDALPENVRAAIAAEQAKYIKIGDDATLTWYGEMDMTGKICLGDLQKSAARVLRVALLSQDMEDLLAALDIDYVAGSYSVNSGAYALDDMYNPVDKEDVKNIGIVAEKVIVDTIAGEDAGKPIEVKVEYKGTEDISSVLLTIDSALPIKDIVSDYDFEFNPSDKNFDGLTSVIVYSPDKLEGELFTIIYELDSTPVDGDYPIDLTLVSVTSSDPGAPEVVAIAIDGAIIVRNTYQKGDITQDGDVSNADLIMIARYLVHLVDFTAKQFEAADYNNDGDVTNADLVLIARAIVSQ